MQELAYSFKSLNSGSRRQQISFASLLPEVGQHKSAPSNTISKGEHLRRLRGEGAAFVTWREMCRQQRFSCGGQTRAGALGVPANALMRQTQTHKRRRDAAFGGKPLKPRPATWLLLQQDVYPRRTGVCQSGTTEVGSRLNVTLLVEPEFPAQTCYRGNKRC